MLYLIPLLAGLFLGWVMAYALPIRKLWAIVLISLFVPIFLMLFAGLFIYFLLPPHLLPEAMYHPTQPLAGIMGVVAGYGVLGLGTFGFAFHRTRITLIRREQKVMEE